MKLILSLIALFSLTVNADSNLSKEYSKEALLRMELANQDAAVFYQYKKSSKGAEVIPYGEYEKAGYLIFSDGFNFNSEDAKLKMAKELPKDMTLVVFTTSTNKTHHKNILEKFHKVIDPSRMKLILTRSRGNGFWARDGVPVPAFGSDGSFYLTDARYYHNFEADDIFAKYFNANLLSHNFYHEGGNFMANRLGDCIVVNNSRAAKITDAVFKDMYGCINTIRLPYIRGIGHVDETLKFMDDMTILTDETRYKQVLEDNGFKVHMLPRADRTYETYANSLLVNGTVFVPIFNEQNDEKALDVYRGFGLKVFGINTYYLSNSGKGSLHCITMTYPDVPFNQLEKVLGGEEIIVTN